MERLSDKWFIGNPRHRGRAIKLFCFSYAGGSAAVFRRWPGSFGPHVEVLAVELPGHGARRDEIPFKELGPLIASLVKVMVPKLDRPFVFFGHSMGALLSFELARRLRSEVGLEPSRLFVSGRRAPHLADQNPKINALPDKEFISELRRLNGTPVALLDDLDIMQFLLPSLRADFKLCEDYGYSEGEPLSCKLAAFGGLSDPEVDRTEISAWKDHTRGPFTMHMFQGDHFFIHSAEGFVLSVVARELLAIPQNLRPPDLSQRLE